VKAKSEFRWNPQATPAANAKASLPALAREFFQAGAKAARSGSTPEELHQFRLASKRFRYTLEIFRPVYGDGLERRIERVRRVQTLLGDLQDCVASRALLAEMYPRPSAILSKALTEMDRRASKCETKFRTSWAADFGKPGEESRWTAYLSRYARDRRAA
jgi:CHAD domain-containing protein